MSNKLIDKALAKIGDRMRRSVLKGSKTISVSNGIYYSGPSITLESNTEYLVLASTASNIGNEMLTLVNVEFSPTPTDTMGHSGRALAGSGNGVNCFYYVKTGNNDVVATAKLYGYYSSTHEEVSRIVAIPLTLLPPPSLQLKVVTKAHFLDWRWVA